LIGYHTAYNVKTEGKRDDKEDSVYETMQDVASTVNMKGKDHQEDPVIDGRIIVKLILKEQDMRVYIGFVWFKADDHFNMVMKLQFS
jgi:hypothetical protein